MTKYKADIGTECSNSHRNCQSFILVMAHAEQLIEQNHNEKKKCSHTEQNIDTFIKVISSKIYPQLL